MATMNRARLLLIRSGIIILAVFGTAFLWLVFDAILPENLLVNVLLGAWSIAFFFLFWDFSMRLDQPGGLLNRATSKMIGFLIPQQRSWRLTNKMRRYGPKCSPGRTGPKLGEKRFTFAC